MSRSLSHTHTLDSGQGIVTEEGLAHPCVNSHHSVPVVSHTHTHTKTHTGGTIHVQAYIRTQAGRGEKVRKKSRFSGKDRQGQIQLWTYSVKSGSLLTISCRGVNNSKKHNILRNVTTLQISHKLCIDCMLKDKKWFDTRTQHCALSRTVRALCISMCVSVAFTSSLQQNRWCS